MDMFTVTRKVFPETYRQVLHQPYSPPEHATRPRAPFHTCIDNLVSSGSQDMACILEAVLYERAMASVGDRSWADYASEMVGALLTTWPACGFGRLRWR